MKAVLANPIFVKLSASPELNTQSLGVEIVIGNELSKVEPNKLWLHGVFQVSHQDAVHIDSLPLQKALVITATSGSLNMTRNLAGDAVLFKDDEIVSDNIHKGYFSYDLTDWLNVYEENDYYITISLGTYLSNTLCVGVIPVPLLN